MPNVLPFQRGPLIRLDSLGDDLKIRVGVWDRFTTWGVKKKGDSPTEFNEKTLGQMVDNWRRRGGRLAMCQDHKSAAAPLVAAPALAFYDALAIIRDGAVVRFEKLAPSQASDPDVGQMKARVAAFASADNESPEPDGLWGFRCEVTPLGEDPKEGLRNYAGISPMFHPEGKDEQGSSIGYVLYDVAATNTAFQAGCEITLGATSTGLSNKENSMNPEMMKRLGLSADASDDDKKAAFKKFTTECAARMSEIEGEEAKKMADDLDAMSAYAGDDGESMKKLASKFRRFASEPSTSDDDKKEEKAKEEMKALAQKLGITLPATARTSAQMFSAISAAPAPAAERNEVVDATARATRERLEKLEAAEATRVAAATAEREQRLSMFADLAIEGGYPKEKRDALIKFARADFDGAYAVVEPLLPKQTGAPKEMFVRLSANGAPLGKGQEARGELLITQSNSKTFKSHAFGTVMVNDYAFAQEIEKVADSKDPVLMDRVNAMLAPHDRAQKAARLIVAEKLVRKDSPHLVPDGE